MSVGVDLLREYVVFVRGGSCLFAVVSFRMVERVIGYGYYYVVERYFLG